MRILRFLATAAFVLPACATDATSEDQQAIAAACSFNCPTGLVIDEFHNPAGSTTVVVSCCANATCSSTTLVCDVTCGNGVTIAPGHSVSGTVTCGSPPTSSSSSSSTSE